MDMLLFLFALLCTIIIAIVAAIRLIIFVRKRTGFPKKTLYLFACSASICFASWLYITYFFSFEQIDRTYLQEGPQHVVSSNETWSASAFYEPYGGAAGGVNVWVEVTDLQTDETKVIYYADAKNMVSLSWQDEQTLHIRNEDAAYENANASIALKVESEIYDEFGRACRSWLMKNDYEVCFEHE